VSLPSSPLSSPPSPSGGNLHLAGRGVDDLRLRGLGVRERLRRLRLLRDRLDPNELSSSSLLGGSFGSFPLSLRSR